MPVDSISPDQATAAPASQQSSPDQAAGDSVAVSTSPTAASLGTASTASPDTTSSPSTTEIELLSQADYDTVKDDPVALRKALNRAATQKFQEVAGLRKTLEPWKPIIDGLSSENPLNTLEVIGRQLGYRIVPANQQDVTPPVTPAQPPVNVREQIANELKATLDDYGLGGAAPAFVGAVERLAQQIAESQVKPLQEHTNRLLNNHQQQEASQLMSRFESRHPDWKAHEAKIVELSKSIRQATNEYGQPLMTDDDYLDQLYYIANREGSVQGEVAKRIQRMQDSARAVEPQTTTVSNDKLSRKAPSGATFRDAVEAAKRGETWQ